MTVRIAVYFREYDARHEKKDPGQIVLGLLDAGIDAELVTLPKTGLCTGGAVPIAFLEGDGKAEYAFWERRRYDAAIAYTGLRADRMWICEMLASLNIKTIVKSDTDGRLAYPLHPRWDMFQGKGLGVLPSIKIARRRLLRKMRRREDRAQLARQIALASATIVETPMARSNLSLLLAEAEHYELISKLHFIPNPVLPCGKKYGQKEKLVVAIGDWSMKFGDYLVKNPRSACAALLTFLEHRPDYRAVLVGAGEDVLRGLLAANCGSSRNRVEVVGQLAHEDVREFLNAAQIYFHPSFSESFSIAAAEAVASGCSVVGSPIEPMYYFTGESASGTIAAEFSDRAYTAALLVEAQEWDRGRRTAVSIGGGWGIRLARREIGLEYRVLLERCILASPDTARDTRPPDGPVDHCVSGCSSG